MNIKELPESERPYEKFLHSGAASLTDADLLAIVLKNGTRNCNSTELARKLLSGKQKNLLNLYEYSYEDLLKFEGIGKVKAIQLKALAELSIRIAATEKAGHINLNQASSVADFFMEQMRHLSEEHVVCAYFDSKSHFLGNDTIFTGSCDRCMVSTKEIFDRVLEKHASFFIMLHNHPSGDPTPSPDDRALTGQVYQGARILGLHFQDHIIIGDRCYYSFYEDNMLHD